MAYSIEVFSVGEDLYAEIEHAIDRINSVQSEFAFKTPPLRLRNDGLPLKRQEYHSQELWRFLRNYRETAKGARPFLVAVLNAPLRSDNLAGIFGSHEAAEGLAAFTLVDQPRYAPSRLVFICYYLVRYSLSFIAPAMKTHQETRGCFFDKKICKRDLAISLHNGRLCDPCAQALHEHLSYEVWSAIEAMIAALKEVLAECDANSSNSVSMAAQSTNQTPAAEDRPCDVFLSYNRESATEVRKVADGLRNRGLRVWFDEWELIPGRSWQEGLERAISSARSAAVFVGKERFGPWQDIETRACLQEFVKRGLPVIPVLLRGASEQPDLPMFLSGLMWVDMRVNPIKSAFDRLEWGIRGTRTDAGGIPAKLRGVADASAKAGSVAVLCFLVLLLVVGEVLYRSRYVGAIPGGIYMMVLGGGASFASIMLGLIASKVWPLRHNWLSWQIASQALIWSVTILEYLRFRW